MELVPYTQIRHLIPPDSTYYVEADSPRLSAYAQERVWFHAGDFDFTDPLNLDQVNACFKAPVYTRFPFFILIQGHARFANVFNGDTDGASGLIVLGNLEANNMVVGGQQIYVEGDLHIKDLFWGDYNHGSLQVQGHFKARACLITEDYEVLPEDLLDSDRSEVEQVLQDTDDEALYRNEHYIHALFKPDYLYQPEDLIEGVFSWKDWLQEAEIQVALGRNWSVLLESWNLEAIPQEEEVPPYFETTEINEANLLKFTGSNILQAQPHTSELLLEYWEGEVFRRVYRQAGQDLSSMFYLQQGDAVAYIVYFGENITPDPENPYVMYKAYRQLPDEPWLMLDETAPKAHQAFLQAQWEHLSQVYAPMHYWWNRLLQAVTIEKVQAILNLPLIQERHNDYYDEDNALYFGNLQWDFRIPENVQGYCPRISIIEQLPDESFDFYHFDIEENGLKLVDQTDDGYEADIFYVSPVHFDKVKHAVQYFEQLEKNIYRLNTEYLEEKDLDNTHFNLSVTALHGLIKLCLGEPYFSTAEDYLLSLNAHDLDTDTELMDLLLRYCQQEELPFLPPIDWEGDPQTLKESLDELLQANFSLEISCNATGLMHILLEEYNQQIQENGLQMGLIRDANGNHYACIHRLNAAHLMDTVLELTSYTYQNLEPNQENF